MSLVRGLVTLHGGGVEAFSEGSKQGSEFVVQLPGSAAPPSEPGKPDRPRYGTRTAPSLRVLLVDDNRDAADTCATLVELAGQQVRIAYSGRSALEVAESFRPEVVGLDIGLPDLDGYQVAQRIRGETWGRSAVLVAVTGWGREDDKKRAFAAGFDHHLTKPIEGAALRSLLHSLSESGSDPSRRNLDAANKKE